MPEDTPAQRLQKALRAAFDTCRQLGEREALEIALGEAETWRMRLDELELEESDHHG